MKNKNQILMYLKKKKVATPLHLAKITAILISDDNTITSELSRRIRMAYRDFNALQRLWSHANITHKKKILIFNACIMSKLLYGFDIAWLRQNELARPDTL